MPPPHDLPHRSLQQQPPSSAESENFFSLTVVIFVCTLLAGVLALRHGERLKLQFMGWYRPAAVASPMPKRADHAGRRRRPVGARPLRSSRAPERDDDLDEAQEPEALWDDGLHVE